MSPPFGGSLTGTECPAPLPVEIIPDQVEHHSGSTEKCSASARNPVRLHPGIAFGINPERCSPLSRKPVRLGPESPALCRIAALHSAGSRPRCSPDSIEPDWRAAICRPHGALAFKYALRWVGLLCDPASRPSRRRAQGWEKGTRARWGKDLHGPAPERATHRFHDQIASPPYQYPLIWTTPLVDDSM